MPEPTRWPQRPQPEKLLFADAIRQQETDHERRRRAIQEAAAASEDRAHVKMIGAVAIVGVAALIGGYLLTRPDPPRTVVASCVRTDRGGAETVVAEHNCSGSAGGGSFRGSSTWPQYNYYYGGNTTLGQPPTGGSRLAPSDAEIRTKSGTVIQRGGLGRGGGSSGS
ncbi:hypothetical protein [Nocardia lasii]|uniref:Uncharacterized protein n=1 Tax=Nocardia lasii TaxID=1616107 RepID=A0ABW1K0R4_9NOCA